mgnify:CR=1 FL=1
MTAHRPSGGSSVSEPLADAARLDVLLDLVLGGIGQRCFQDRSGIPLGLQQTVDHIRLVVGNRRGGRLQTDIGRVL